MNYWDLCAACRAEVERWRDALAKNQVTYRMDSRTTEGDRQAALSRDLKPHMEAIGSRCASAHSDGQDAAS